MNCDKLNKVLSVPSYSYTAPTVLGIKVKKISAGLVCFSFFFWLRVLDKAEYSAFESTLNSPIVSYRSANVFYSTFLNVFLFCPRFNLF